MNSLNSEPFMKDLDTLLFLEDKEPKDEERQIRAFDENIFYLKSEKADPDSFLPNLKEIFLKKIELLIKAFLREADCLSNQKSDDDEQIRKLKLSISQKNKADKCILLGDYRQSSMLYGGLVDIAKQINDNILVAKSYEGVGISLFLMDYIYSKKSSDFKFKFNSEIEANLNNSGEKYKKFKINECYIDILFKLVNYYVLFEGKIKNFNETVKRIMDELDQSNSFFKLNCLLKIHYLFNTLELKRKGSFYLYLVIN